jgi:hypothetical protein
LIIYLGLDVHKESIAVAVLPAAASVPTRVDRLPHDRAVADPHQAGGAAQTGSSSSPATIC